MMIYAHIYIYMHISMHITCIGSPFAPEKAFILSSQSSRALALERSGALEACSDYVQMSCSRVYRV